MSNKWKRIKMLAKYRFKLFKSLYLRRFSVIAVFLMYGVISNYVNEGDTSFLVLGFIALSGLFLIFMFPDYHNPGNNPVKDLVKKYQKENKDYKKLEKALKREEKINKILK